MQNSLYLHHLAFNFLILFKSVTSTNQTVTINITQTNNKKIKIKIEQSNRLIRNFIKIYFKRFYLELFTTFFLEINSLYICNTPYFFRFELHVLANNPGFNIAGNSASAALILNSL
jgi:hypothetical protein